MPFSNLGRNSETVSLVQMVASLCPLVVLDLGSLNLFLIQSTTGVLAPDLWLFGELVPLLAPAASVKTSLACLLWPRA